MSIAAHEKDWMIKEAGINYNEVRDFVSNWLDTRPTEAPHHPRFQFINFKHILIENKGVQAKLITLVQNSVLDRVAYVHVMWSYVCSTSLPKQSKTRVDLSNRINQTVRNLMQEKRGDFTKEEKEFIKICLAFCYPTRYGELFDALQTTAREVLEEIQQPLLDSYREMTQRGSELLSFHKNISQSYFDKTIKRQQQLWSPQMLKECLQWYEKSEMSNQSNHLIAKQWYQRYRFDWGRIQRLRMKGGEYHGGRITLNVFKSIARELQTPFQSLMADLGVQNRKAMGRPARSQFKEVGARAPDPKSISRAQHKAFKDYKNEPLPREGSILDYLRCAVVVEDEPEFLSLFWLIMNKFKGRVIRVKNGFDPEAECNYGYRAAMINLIFEHPDPVMVQNGRIMISEVQIILRDYLRVRKKMHLYYKVVRAHEQWAIGRDFCKRWDL